MTKTDAAIAIELATRGTVWAMANATLRRKVILGLIERLEEESPEATKPIKKRKPRKAKAAPLTQHATAQEDE